MSFTSRLAQTKHVREIAEAGLLGVSSRVPLGTNVFERDWDLLVVLDTCRYDALSEMEPEFDFVSGVEPVWSVGSSTREWAANTYTARYRSEIERTALVCGNLQVKSVLETGHAVQSGLSRRFASWDTVDTDDLLALDPVSDYAPLNPYGGILTPDVVTDRAIDVARTYDADRTIVHYIAPHNPYLSNALRENRETTDYEYRPFDYLRNGGDRDLVCERYLDELRWVLEYVGVLLENVDAETAVITADHGELFGELGLYSHPTGVPHPNLRRVPWMETTATDTGSYEPHFEKPAEDAVDETTAEQLEHLGYR